MYHMLKPFIDAHVHLNTTSMAKMELALQRGAAFLSINTDIPMFDSLHEQEQVILKLKREYPGRVFHITSFDNKYWNTDRWLSHVLHQIQEGIANGAVGVKMWKNIGMDKNLTDKSSRFVMMDDERFDPIYEFLVQQELPLLGHQGEPRNCWLPLDEMTVNSDREYFRRNPQYHMYLHPEYPSYEEQMKARDHVLEKYPDLKFVGLHLFSMEWDVDQVASLLSRFPNTMTDLAERICHVQLQARDHHQKVRNFFIRYQDRIIYGTDVIDDGTLSDRQLCDKFSDLWQRHWDFFASGNTLDAPEFEGKFQGLHLPEEVLNKIFFTNAAKTYGFTKNPLTHQTNINYER